MYSAFPFCKTSMVFALKKKTKTIGDCIIKHFAAVISTTMFKLVHLSPPDHSHPSLIFASKVG
jgi:hypothetical protein